MSQEESSDSSEEIKHRAFVVADLPRNFDPSKPPTSAEEYLHHVMWEARQCDNVVTVKLDKSRIKTQIAVVKPNIKAIAPAGYLPSGATQETLLTDFMRTKEEVERLRNSSNKPKPCAKLPTSGENPDHWCEFCYGSAYFRSFVQKQQRKPKPSSSGSPTKSEQPERAPQQPLLSILLNIKQATLQNLMEWNVGWLELSGFTDHQGKWLYSLLSCLEKPLTPELCDNVRQMVFLCARDRAKLDSKEHAHLPQLNLIITIITRYFNQDDLADPK